MGLKATTVLGWIRNRPRYLLAILLAAACGYAMDRWFFPGLIASKWIGLPQFALAMRELQNEFRNWGIGALALEIAALALVWPRWPEDEPALTRNSPLTLSTGLKARTEYLSRCILHVGLCLLGTLGFAILIPVIFGSFGAILRAK
jgi:hypothetical protein